LFIPDPDPDFLHIPDQGVKKAPDSGSGSATLNICNSVVIPDLGVKETPDLLRNKELKYL
jgi:hypothetical protein